MAADSPAHSLRVFLSGDVMTGRGIDQILHDSSNPVLYETWAKSALRYVELAEQRNGPIPKRVGPDYVWGDSLRLLDAVDVRIVNLETAVTDHDEPWPAKGINYRMHPDNVDTIAAADIDCCVLANNHTLDWSYPGLIQTLDTLHRAGITTAGAGRDEDEATRPAVIEAESGQRVIVIAIGATSSGIPRSWAARPDRPGLFVMGSISKTDVDDVAGMVEQASHPGDLVIVSIHWGPNWGYDIPSSHRDLAHRLIDDAGVHVVHGHSSHHPIGIEVYRDHLVLYGCGDLINDYEGIAGHEQFHPDLGIIYLATFSTCSGTLASLDLVPMRMRRFRLERAPSAETTWLQEVLARESHQFGVGLESRDDRLQMVW